MKILKRRFNNVATKVLSVSLALAMIFGIGATSPVSASAATKENVSLETVVPRGATLANRGGVLQPGQTVSGTFKINKLLGTTGWHSILSVGNGSGYFTVSIESEQAQLNCGNTQTIMRSAFPYGTYNYSITSHASSACAYSFWIYED